MKSPLKNGIGEVITDYGRRVMRIFKRGLLGRSLFDFYGDVKADTFRIKESTTIPPTPSDGKGGILYTKSSDGKLFYKSNEVSEVELSVTGANTTFSVSCVDGDNSDEEKIRLTGSDSSTDDVVLEAGTGLSIARDGDKITFTNTVSDTNTFRNVTAGGNTLGSSESLDFVEGSNITISESGGDITISSTDTNTQLSTEQVQDIAGPLVATGGTKTGISVTYDDTNNNMDFVVSDLTVAGDSGSTGMTPGDTLTIAGGTNVTTAMSGDTLTITSTDTNTNQLTTFQLEDADGDEVTISHAKEVKFTGQGVTINWTDTDNGTDGDPYVLDFAIDNITVGKGGTGATSFTSNAILTGNGSSAIQSESTLLYDSEQITIGAADNGPATIRRSDGSSSRGGSLVLQGGSGNGTDNQGGDVVIKLGIGTGAGDSGSFKIEGHAGGSSGSSAGSLTQVASIDQGGNLQVDGGITTGSTSFVNSSGVIQVATQGTIDHDSLANFVAAEHYRWDTDISSTATIHANNIPTLNQNTSGTAAGLSGSSLTTVNSILNTALVAGRDADNQIKFSTDNQIIFRVSGNDGVIMRASGEIEATKFDGDLEGNADTATALETARNIGGVSFDGTGNINLPGVNTAGNQNTTGSAATLTTARNIGGVSFNGSANIDLPGVNTNGTQSIEYTPTSSEQAAGNNSAIIIKEGDTTTVAGKVYYLAPNGTWVLANAGAEGTRSGLLGVAVGTNSTTNGMVTKGLVTISTHATSGGVGKTVYLHTTDGLMTTTAPSSVRILGAIVKHHSNRCEVYFNPDNFNGQAANPGGAFTDNKSLTFDGTGDYAVASLPTDWGKSTGTFSFWVNLNITDDTSKYLVSFTTGDGSFNDFVLLMYYKVTTAKYAIICRQKRTISGVSTEHVTVAQQSSSYHGRPFARVSSDFTSIQQNYNSIRTSDTWTHIAVTWSNAVSSTYTYNGVTYNGNQTIYVNGTKVGEGTSTMPGHNASGTSNSMSQARVNNLNNVYLGALSPSHGMANMVMNDLAIWSSALDADNITAIYNSGTPTDLTTGAGNYDEQGNLVGYWKMEDNTNDSSSNSNSLSLYADTTYVSDTPP